MTLTLKSDLTFFFGDGNRGAPPPLRAFPSPRKHAETNGTSLFHPKKILFFCQVVLAGYAGKNIIYCASSCPRNFCKTGLFFKKVRLNRFFPPLSPVKGGKTEEDEEPEPTLSFPCEKEEDLSKSENGRGGGTNFLANCYPFLLPFAQLPLCFSFLCSLSQS